MRFGNPIVPGWYADPEARIFEGEYWIYPDLFGAVRRAALLRRVLIERPRHLDAPHRRILEVANVKWATRAVWAPSIVVKDGWYYLFFSANDIQNDTQLGGIGVARARTPGGPFIDYLGKPLVDRFHNGAQPIDPFVFSDADGTYYLIYGGWRHCNIAKLNATSPASCRSATARCSRRSRRRATSKARGCSLMTAGTTSCGPRADGRARTTRSRMRSADRRWGRSNEPAKSSSRIPRSRPARGTTPSFMRQPRARLVHRLSPAAAGRSRPQSSRRLHRRDAV